MKKNKRLERQEQAEAEAAFAAECRKKAVTDQVEAEKVIKKAFRHSGNHQITRKPPTSWSDKATN